jgi:signal transduction histidine kinase
MASLRGRIGLIVALLSLAAVAVVTVTVAVATSRSIDDALAAQADAQVTITKALSSAGARQPSWAAVAPVARKLAERYDVRIVVTDLNLQPAIDTGSGELPPLAGALDPFGPLGAVEGGTSAFDKGAYAARLGDCFSDNGIATVPTDLGLKAATGSDPAAVAACVAEAKESAASPSSGANKEPALLFVSAASTAQVPWGAVTLIAAGVIGTAALAALPLSRLVTRPLADLSQAAGAIRSGDLGARASDDAPTEVAALARSFNAMAAELQASAQRRKQLTADTAHELRSPLTNVRNHLDAIEDGLIQPTAEELATVGGEVDRLTGLVADLETLAAVDAHELHLETEPVDVASVAAAVAAAARGSALAAGVAIDLRTAGPAVAAADRRRLAQILRNLVDNAVQHTPPGGTVSVAVGGGAGTVEIRVRDTGAGIAAEDLPRVFDRLWRADPARASAGGRGLGLSIAQGLAHAQGGRIDASNDPAGGAVFVLTLPREMTR